VSDFLLVKQTCRSAAVLTVAQDNNHRRQQNVYKTQEIVSQMQNIIQL